MNPDQDLDFYYRSIERFADWIKYADAKAAAALVILGLGLNDVLDHARLLVNAHSFGGAGWVATVAFWTSCTLAAYVVSRVAGVFFPSLVAREPSVFYFRTIVASFKSPSEYRDAVAEKSDEDLRDEVGGQAWELARIADAKFAQSQKALFWTLVFLGTWAVGRVALAYAH